MRTKYEIDKETGLLKLDRILFSSVHYPANYGFIPQTMGEDGDPLDVMVICKESILPMCLVPSRIIGVMRMVDQGVTDDKILAVPVMDAGTRQTIDVEDLDEGFKQELKSFFENYTVLENKTVHVPEFLSKEVAKNLIALAVGRYSKNHKAK
jgi:inorganic pyrophosphatase